MNAPLVFVRVAPESVEICVVTYASDGTPSLIAVPISHERAIVLGNDLITLGVRRFESGRQK